MTLLESRVEGLWGAKQSAKGTPATLADKQFRKVGGDVNVNRDDSSENWSDGSRFGDATDFVNQLIGDGAPVAQAQPGPSAWAAAMLLGSESVSSAGPNYDHIAVPGNASYWLTLWKKVGLAVGPLKQKFNDSRIVSLRIEGSSANKVCKITLQVLSLDSGEIFTTDPVKTLDVDLPFIYTEGAGRFTIDGQVYQGHSSFAIVINDAITPWYGDSVTPYDVGYGTSQVALEGITIAVDNAGLQRYYQQIYGTTAPTVGQKPMTTLPGRGSYSVDLRKGSAQRIAMTGAPTGGSTAVTVPGGYGTATIQWNSTAAQAQTQLTALPGLSGKVTVTGGPLPATPLDVVFTDAGIAVMTKVDSLTGGSTPASVITDNGHNRGLKIEVPGVQWSPDVAVAGNPDGGPTEMALGAQARPTTGQPIIRITSRNGDSAAY